MAKEIIYTEKSNLHAARILREAGYKIATPDGVKVDTPDSVIGILKQKGEAERRGLLGLLGIKTKPRSLFIGRVWTIGSIIDHIEVFGREYVQELGTLAERLDIPDDRDRRLELTSEHPYLEKRDWGFE